MNIFTGERGITVDNPFNPGNDGLPICPAGVVCPGPWKPTGVLSGGLNGHAFITSAAQHALTELHRNGTPIRTVKLPMDDNPGFGTVPRLLGTQFMPNGNIIQAVCDANFFNASNSDQNPGARGGNSSLNYFPPVYSTPERAQNSRLLVLDQETLEVIDEYSAPDDPNRRDSLRAISFDESGNLYATNRARSQACVAGEADCNPGVFRQRISIVLPGDNYPSYTLALDPGVNVIAGIRTNRMSGPGCDEINPADPITGIRPSADACDVETLLVAASAMNPGCVDQPGHPANKCFTPGGYVAEYLIDAEHLDGFSGDCTGNPAHGFGAGQGNEGCAQPIATFFGVDEDNPHVDPRMLMVIHEAFVQ